LGFFWKGKYYTFVCMTFGTVVGPWVWDRILSPVIDLLKSNKVNSHSTWLHHPRN
jgi:hypothetical protein